LKGVGLKIKELITEKKVNVPELAKLIGKTKQSVYGYLDKEDIDTSILRKIAEVLEVPVSSFFEDASTGIKNFNKDGVQNIGVKNAKSNFYASGDTDKILLLEQEVKHLKEKLKESKQLSEQKEASCTERLQEKDNQYKERLAEKDKMIEHFMKLQKLG